MPSHYLNQCWNIVNWAIKKNVSEILIEIQALSFKKMHVKTSSGKCRPFCLDLSVLLIQQHTFFIRSSTFLADHATLYHNIHNYLPINHYMILDMNIRCQVLKDQRIPRQQWSIINPRRTELIKSFIMVLMGISLNGTIRIWFIITVILCTGKLIKAVSWPTSQRAGDALVSIGKQVPYP